MSVISNLKQLRKKALDFFPRLPRRIVAWKARRIPKPHRRRMLREVLADLGYIDSWVEELNFALGFNWSDVTDIPDTTTGSECEENEVE